MKRGLLSGLLGVVMLVMVLATTVTVSADTLITSVCVVGQIEDGDNLFESGDGVFTVTGTGVKSIEIVYYKDDVKITEDGYQAYDGTFRAEIHVYAKSGYTFNKGTIYSMNGEAWSSGMIAGKSKISVVSNTEVIIRTEPTDCGRKPTNAKISHVEITDLVEPKAGEKIKTTATVGDSEKYEIKNLYYNGSASVFICDQAYVVTIVLQAKESYEFDEAKNITAIINCKIGTVVSVSSYNKTLTVSYAYPTTTHIEKQVKVDATCTENGSLRIICELCGEELAGGVIVAEGHKFENGVCTVCGEKDPDAKEEEGTSKEDATEDASAEQETSEEGTTEDASGEETSTEDASGEATSTEVATGESESGEEDTKGIAEFFDGIPMWLILVPVGFLAVIVILLVLLIVVIKKSKNQ